VSDKSGIQWTDATWNPVRGCTRVSEGCRNCYAERQTSRFPYGQPYAQNGKWTGRVELIEARLDQPLRWRKPRRVFVNSMSDLFHESLPDEAIDMVFAVMALAPRHTFQVLTKRPERMLALASNSGRLSRVAQVIAADFGRGEESMRLRWPIPNVWLGVSVEDQATADERIPLLFQTPAALRFVSYEPALGPVAFQPWLRGALIPGVDWLIVGGESGPGARPFDVAWARSAVAQCKAAGVPVFVKQLGALPITRCSNCGITVGRVLGGFVDICGPTHALLVAEFQRIRNSKGGDPDEWPEDLRVREFPRA